MAIQGSDSTPGVGDSSLTLSFSELVFSDFERHRPSERRPSWPQIILRCLTLTGMVASIVLRAQQCLYRAGYVRIAWVLRTVGIVLVGADFVPGMTIGTGLVLPHPVGLVMGNSVRIGDNVMIAQGVTLGVSDADPTSGGEVPTICDGASVLANATVIGGVRVGTGARVGANSLVVADIPDYALAVGVPARKIGEVEHSENEGSSPVPDATAAE
jgi:serine O-acetyltransferase